MCSTRHKRNAALSHDLVSELSLHPHAPNAQGTMNSFAPQEILTANPPMHPLQTIFRLHISNRKSIKRSSCVR